MPLLSIEFAIFLIMRAIHVLIIFFYDGFARPTSMIETINEQQVKFANKIREYDLSHKIDLRFNSPKCDVYLCDGWSCIFPSSRVQIRGST